MSAINTTLLQDEKNFKMKKAQDSAFTYMLLSDPGPVKSSLSPSSTTASSSSSSSRLATATERLLMLLRLLILLLALVVLPAKLFHLAVDLKIQSGFSLILFLNAFPSCLLSFVGITQLFPSLHREMPCSNPSQTLQHLQHCKL